MSQHNLLRISSKDRDKEQSQSPSNFTVNFQNSSGVQSVKRIVVKQVSIPNVFYNINSTNNQFQYRIGGGSITTVTVPEGQYSISEFKTAFETALASVGMTLTLGSTSRKYNLVTTTAIEYLTLDDGNPMGDVLGITTGSGADVTTFNSQGMPNLAGLTEVYVSSNTLSDNSNMISGSKSSHPIVVSVPITSTFGAYTHYMSNHETLDEIVYPSQGQGKNLQSIDIKILDRDGDEVNLQGLEFEMILKMYY